MYSFSSSFPLTSKRRRRSLVFILVLSLYFVAELYLVDVFVLCFFFYRVCCRCYCAVCIWLLAGVDECRNLVVAP